MKGVPQIKASGNPLRRIRRHPTVKRFFNAATESAQKFPTTFRLRSAQINSIGFSSGAYGGDTGPSPYLELVSGAPVSLTAPVSGPGTPPAIYRVELEASAELALSVTDSMDVYMTVEGNWPPVSDPVAMAQAGQDPLTLNVPLGPGRWYVTLSGTNAPAPVTLTASW